MNDYKGIFHDTQDTTKYYEFGAHFKHLDLYESLLNLEKEKENDIPLNENLFLQKNIVEEKARIKSRKRYKLNTDINENKRYLNINTDLNQNENEKNIIPIIKEERNVNITNKRKKRGKFLTKSLDKVKLPEISMKNVNNNINLKNDFLYQNEMTVENKENNYPLKLSSKSIGLNRNSIKQKNKDFPKINSLYFSEIFKENKNRRNIDEETQSIFQDNNAAIKIFNIEEGKMKREQKMPYRIFNKYPDNNIKVDKLKSIFEREKEVKINNLFLGQKNNYSPVNRNLKNKNMAKHIHNLKMQLLIKASEK